MFRFMRLFIDMLSSKALEKHKKELTRIKQELQASRLNLEAITQANKKLTTENRDLNDSYRNIFLSEHMAKQDLAELTSQLIEANVGLETASQENIQLQAQLEEAEDIINSNIDKS